MYLKLTDSVQNPPRLLLQITNSQSNELPLLLLEGKRREKNNIIVHETNTVVVQHMPSLL